MINSRLNEKGLTLVELLVVLLFISIISVFVISITIQSLETTNKVRIENTLRDEADLMMSSFIKAMYETRSANIAGLVDETSKNYINIVYKPNSCPKKEDGSWDISNETACDVKKLGFETIHGNEAQFYLINREGTNHNQMIYKPVNSNIKILNSSNISIVPNSTNTYKIELVLEYTSKQGGTREMTFENTIQPF